jgi:CBS domain-containing protein
MQAKDVMSRDVVTVEPDDTITQAAGLMLTKRLSGLPVVDKAGALVGIVTEGDFLRRAEIGTTRRRPRWIEFLVGPGRLAGEYTHAAGRVVREIMSREVQTVAEDTPLPDVVALMEKRHIKRLPVMSGATLAGIVTRQDLLRAVVGASSTADASDGDREIRDRFIEEIRKQPWAPPAVHPVVIDGYVTLRGTIFDDRQREALTVLAQNIPGVKCVEDQLIWIEPMSGTVIENRAA